MGLTQIISSTQMYLDHYAYFEEPDDDLPRAIYLDGDTKMPSLSLDLFSPVAVQHFSRKGDNLVLGSRYFKTMPYQIEPAAFPAPIPPQVLDFFSTITFHTVQPSEIQAIEVAVGQFDLPPPASVTGTLSGSTLTITKEVRFRVQIRLAFVYPPLHLGVQSPFVTNGQAAAALSIPVPPGTDPAAALAYEWGATLTLSTANNFVRPVATLPPAFANPFAATTTEVRIEGQAVDADNHYTVVGSTTGVVPTSTVPQILQVLFGTVTPVCQFAYSESGTLLHI